MAKKNSWQIATFVLIGVLVLGLITGFIVFGGEKYDTRWANNACSALTNSQTTFVDFSGSGSRGDLNILCSNGESFWLRPDE